MQSDLELNKIFDALPDLVAVIDNKHRIVKINQAMARKLGASPEKYIGKSCFRCVHKKNKPLIFCPHAATMSDGKEHSACVYEENLGGHFLVATTPLFDNKNKLIGSVHTMRDITELKQSEEALRKLQAQMAAIFENIDGGFIALDKNWNYIYINKTAANNLFKEPQDLIGKNIWQEFPKLIGSVIEANFRKAMKKRVTLHYEEKGIETDRWYENHIYPIPEGIAIFWSNITQRRQIENNLEKIRTDLNHAQKVAHMGSWHLDTGKNELLWSDETYRIFGISKKVSLTYEKFLSMVYKADRPYVDAQWQAALRGQTYDIEHRIISRGKIRWVREKAELEFNDSGELLGGFGTVQDITKHKRIQEKLDHLASFPRLNPNPVLEFDSKGGLLFCNNSAAVLLGKYNISEKAKLFLPGGFAKLARFFKKNPHKFVNREAQINNEIFLETITFIPQNQTIRIYAQDITERKRAEEEKNNFIAIMSHELRNPLTPILSGIQMIKQLSKNWQNTPESKEIRGIANIVEQQSKNLSRLLDDLLDIARISRGKIILKKRRIGLCECIDSAINAVEPLMAAQKHRFQKYIRQCPIVLEADPVRIEQIIVNLLNNAIKYTPPNGKIKLTARQIGKEAIISIKDNGIGIEPQKMHFVFELFSREAKPFITTLGELGIGLRLVKDLVDLHKGVIIPKSRGINKGCEFIVKLPALVLNNASDSGISQTNKPDSKTSPKAMKVLVVDDNTATANLLSKAIKMFGHNVLSCNDGRAAVLAIKKFKPDIAFIDIGLPILNGYEVAQKARAMQVNKKQKTKLIALTGYGQESDKQKSRQAGFDLHLVKPVGLEGIKAALRGI